jgi:hypothetical protein
VVVAVGVEPAPAWVLGPEHLLEVLERLAQVVAGLSLFVVGFGAGLKFVHFPLGVRRFRFVTPR